VGAAAVLGQNAGAQQQTGSTQLAAVKTPERPHRAPDYLPADVDSAVVKCGRSVQLRRDGTKYGGFITLQIWNSPNAQLQTAPIILDVDVHRIDRSIEWRTPDEHEDFDIFSVTFREPQPGAGVEMVTARVRRDLASMESELTAAATALLRDARTLSEQLYEAACRGQPSGAQVTLDAKQPAVQALLGRIQRLAQVTDPDVPVAQRLRAFRQELSMK
jgi:hypothetical protein